MEYRCGCYAESLQTLKTYDSLESLFFRTMALFKLGQTEAAQQLFSRAGTIASQMDPRVPAIGPWEEQPIVYCWVQQLAHEAAGVLNLPYPVASSTDAPANERWLEYEPWSVFWTRQRSVRMADMLPDSVRATALRRAVRDRSPTCRSAT